MGIFDKEKFNEMANKAKSAVKESIEDAKAEQERKKELGLLNDVTIKLDYKGGHPALTKEKECSLKITNYNIVISYGLSSATVDFSNFTSVNFETAEQISRRITATRLLTLGVFAFAFKKKKKDTEKYLTIEFEENGIESAIVFGGKKVQDAYSKLYEKYAAYKNRESSQEINNTEENAPLEIDSYAELKQLKELLDMGIITQEEFDAKKKELLGL